MKAIRLPLLLCCLLPSIGFASEQSVEAPGGWTVSAPGDEIRPEFSHLVNDGPRGRMSLITRMDAREGLQGAWQKTHDAFFPEVARQLTINGAEIIALPVWGCNPALAAARATENHVWLVSNTYTSHDDNWIKSAIFDHEGKMVSQATAWGQVIVVEVDLDERRHWHGLGDFKARIHRGRPEWRVEK